MVERQADGAAERAGLHRVVWDLRTRGRRIIPEAKIDCGRAARAGRWSLPGSYTLRLTVDGKTRTAKRGGAVRTRA